MPLAPPADQVQNSLREALVLRGYRPDPDGALRVPLWELPDTGGEVRRLARHRERWVELHPEEDHSLSDEAWAALLAAPPKYGQYQRL